MKTVNQIKLIKVGYLIILFVVVLFAFDDMSQGFKDGWDGSGKLNSLPFIYMILIFLIAFLGLRILIYLYRFIDSLQTGDVFSKKNTNRLTQMGWYCIIVPVLLFISNAIEYVNTSPFIQKDLVFRIINNVDFQIWLLIFGLTLLTIAFVFKKGIVLQQENDLTI